MSVRLISQETYAAIVVAAGVGPSALPQKGAPLSGDTLQEIADLLRVRLAVVTATGVIVSHAFRRSTRAAAIGRRAEQLVHARERRRGSGNVPGMGKG